MGTPKEWREALVYSARETLRRLLSRFGTILRTICCHSSFYSIYGIVLAILALFLGGLLMMLLPRREIQVVVIFGAAILMLSFLGVAVWVRVLDARKDTSILARIGRYQEVGHALLDSTDWSYFQPRPL